MGEEEWKIIPEFDLYEISNYGRLRSRDRVTRNGSGFYIKKGGILKGIDNGNGYKKANLKQGGISKKYYIHRLVAMAFIPNPENKPFINHKDNDPSNNCADNLEWCTPQENVDWMQAQGRNKRTDVWLSKMRKAQEKYYKPVIAINKETGERIEFEYLNSVKNMGFCPSSVCRCCKGEAYQHKGYIWRYADE